MRLALIDRPDGGGRIPLNRFTGLADHLRGHGHEVRLIDWPDVSILSPPILIGCNRALSARPLVEAHLAARTLASYHADVILAPLRGGIAQGVLMARACGEAFANARVALWCDTPSHARFATAEDGPPSLGALVADALERQALALADALITPDAIEADRFAGFSRPLQPTFKAALPAGPTTVAPRHGRASEEIEEIVFVGPIAGGSGIAEFIEAVQNLAGEGLLAARTVTFLGPMRKDVQGIGAEWLGATAASWTFPFKVLDEHRAETILQYLSTPRRLAVAIGDDPEDFELVRQSGEHHCLLLRSPETPRLVERIGDSVKAALQPVPNKTVTAAPSTDWNSLIHHIRGLPCRRPRAETTVDGITVCILHHNRLPFLETALASIPDFVRDIPVEIIVLDNASEGPSIEEDIRRRAGPRPHLRIIASPTPLPQAAARNRSLAAARFDTVLFLDDDNAYTPDGVARLATAIGTSNFDVVVTPLEIFDDDVDGDSAHAGRLVFLGAAHSAGLFFNGFGDTAMAVRRSSFLKIGGFHDPGHSYPCLDWVTLAKAQAAGLQIGVMQWSAVRYRRDTAGADLVPHKIDQEGARSLVFEVYGDAFDARLVARYAQKLQLDEL